MANSTSTIDSADSARTHTKTIVGGRYELLELKGKGGMGAVYRGFDLELGRVVALKRILTGSTLSVHDTALREARTLASLNHPHIVAIHDIVHDVEKDEKKNLWLVTAWLDGRSLKELSLPLHPLAVLGIMTQVMSALSAAHKLKIFHRDVNPSNIMINKEGRVILIDFGVASSPGISTGETIAGTLKYTDPRIFEGKPADALSDLFSAALVTLELLTGKQILPDLAPLPLYHFIKNELVKKIDSLCEGFYPPLKKFAKTYLNDQDRMERLNVHSKLTDEAHSRLRDMFAKLTALNPEECTSLFLDETTPPQPEIFLPFHQEAKEALNAPSLSPREKADWISFSSQHLDLNLGEVEELHNHLKASTKKYFLLGTVLFLCLLIGGTLFYRSKQRNLIPTNEPSHTDVVKINSQPQLQSLKTNETPSSLSQLKTVPKAEEANKTTSIKNTTSQDSQDPQVSPQNLKTSQVYFSANAWADLYIDNTYMGRLPMAKAFPLKQGKHTIRLENPYMESLNQNVKVAELPQERFRFELKPKIMSHILVLKQPGNLTIDGVNYGVTEEKEVKLSHGIHHVVVTRGGENSIDIKKFFGPDTPKRVALE